MKRRILFGFFLIALCSCAWALDKSVLKLLFNGSPDEVKAWADKAGSALNEDIFADLRPIMLIADRFDPEAPEAARSQVKSMYEYFIKKGARLDPWSCARVGDLARLKKVLSDEPGARDFVNGTGETLLGAAAKSGTFECLDYLLSLGLDANGADARDATPLMYASHGGDASMAKRLLKAGASIDLRDGEGKTALDYARAAGKQSVADILSGAATDR